MRSLGVPLLYWGQQRGPSRPSPLRLAPTRTGQRGMQRHVGWQAAEMVWWLGLHEDLHATTQVLADLVRKLVTPRM